MLRSTSLEPIRQRLIRCWVKATASIRSSDSAGGLSSLRFDSSITTSDSRSSSAASKSGLAMASAMISSARGNPSLGTTK